MSDTELKQAVIDELKNYPLDYSDEDLTIIIGNVSNWLTCCQGCTLKEAVQHTVNYEGPWSEY